MESVSQLQKSRRAYHSHISTRQAPRHGRNVLHTRSEYVRACALGGSGRLQLAGRTADQFNDILRLQTCYTLPIHSQESIAHAQPAVLEGAALRIDFVDDEGQQGVSRDCRFQDYAETTHACGIARRARTTRQRHRS